MDTEVLVSARSVAAVSVLALVFGFGGNSVFLPINHLSGAAFAQSTGHGSGQGAGMGGHSGAPAGDESDHTDDGGKKGPKYQGGSGMTGGYGQSGLGAHSDGQGPRAGAQGANRGGKPVWSQEGIPEVELGRLNVVRSPRYVLDRAHAEALASLSPAMAAFYSKSLSDIVLALSTDFDAQTYIDSPLQNLALLRDALDGSISLPGVSNSNQTLMAVFLGTASDKTIPISANTVIAVTTILGTPITGTAATNLAADAEEVRIAILAGHG